MCLSPSRTCVCSHSLLEFLCASLLYPEGTVSLGHLLLLALTVFLPPLPQRSLSFEGRGSLIMTSHLGLPIDIRTGRNWLGNTSVYPCLSTWSSKSFCLAVSTFWWEQLWITAQTSNVAVCGPPHCQGNVYWALSEYFWFPVASTSLFLFFFLLSSFAKYRERS